MIPLLLPFLFTAEPGCLVIDNPRITAGDLGRRVVAFQSLEKDTVFAPSPLSGVRRELSASTLKQWALLHGLATSNLEPFCIYRRSIEAVEVAWESELRQALVRLYGLEPGPGELKILSTQLTRGGAGTLSLEKSDLSMDVIAKHYLWRGSLKSGGFNSTARIRFHLKWQERRLVTARALPAARALAPEDFEWADFPFRPDLPPTDQLNVPPIGKVLRRSLPRHALVLPLHLMEAPMIFPGDPVELLSRSGNTTIQLKATARGNARLGESILVAAFESKRMLRAIVVAPGRVLIQEKFPKATQ